MSLLRLDGETVVEAVGEIGKSDDHGELDKFSGAEEFLRAVASVIAN